MSDFVYSEGSYCARCDFYFDCHKERRQHIEESSNHPQCDYCMKRFLNNNTLRTHYILSPYHHYCSDCDLHFETSSGLRIHVETSVWHRDDCDEDDEDDETLGLAGGKMDEDGYIVFPNEDPIEKYGDVYTGDDSWEDFDDCDFEDEDDLGDSTNGVDADCNDELEAANGVAIDKLACPICGNHSRTLCLTICGHLFCSPCIQMAYYIQGSCPVCDEAGTVQQLRRLYISI